VEGWLRQRVSDGKDNSCNEIVFIHDLSLWECFFSCFRNKSLRHQYVHVFTAETLNVWPYTVRNMYGDWYFKGFLLSICLSKVLQCNILSSCKMLLSIENSSNGLCQYKLFKGKFFF
jgi:hypothetical protein